MKRLALSLAICIFAGSTVATANEPSRPITIEGKRLDGRMMGQRTLLIDTIDGKRLDKPRSICVVRVERLPRDVRIKLQGYERRRIPAIESFAEDATCELPDDTGPSEVTGLTPQCELVHWFEPVKVIEPATLELPKQKLD